MASRVNVFTNNGHSSIKYRSRTDDVNNSCPEEQLVL